MTVRYMRTVIFILNHPQVAVQTKCVHMMPKEKIEYRNSVQHWHKIIEEECLVVILKCLITLNCTKKPKNIS